MKQRNLLIATYLGVFLLLIVYVGFTSSGTTSSSTAVESQDIPLVDDVVETFSETRVALPEVLPAATSQMPKKFYIPLASAELKSLNTWGDTGAEIYIDTADYPGGTFTWEASLRIPTGNGRMCARLLNVNDNVQIWGSEICSGGHEFQLVTSSPLTLWQGKKLYRVQFKTTMDYEAVMEGARIIISY